MEKVKRVIPAYLSPLKNYFILHSDDSIQELSFKKQTSKFYRFYDAQTNEEVLITKDKRYAKTKFYHTKQDAYKDLCNSYERIINYYQFLIDHNQPHIAYSREGVKNRIIEFTAELNKYRSILATFNQDEKKIMSLKLNNTAATKILKSINKMIKEKNISMTHLSLESYANGREHGFCLKNYANGKQASFSEFRTSDNLVVYMGYNFKPNSNVPTEYAYSNKKLFNSDQEEEAAQFILENILLE